MIDGKTKLVAFFAHPAKHSMSPLMHNTSYESLGLNYRYLAFDIGGDDEAIKEAVQSMRRLGIAGANVSMPFKKTIIPYLDEVAEEAILADSVNTVVNRGGKLIGYSTDGAGFVDSLSARGISLSGKKIFLVGCGGAGRAILISSAKAGARVVVFNRPGKRYDEGQRIVESLRQTGVSRVEIFSLEDREKFEAEIIDSDIIVNATNLGMGDAADESWLDDPKLIQNAKLVYDCIYEPRETKLMKDAVSVGVDTMNGLEMLLYQGAAAHELITGVPMDVDSVRKVLK
jgi:shikimate dehydrogenase